MPRCALLAAVPLFAQPLWIQVDVTLIDVGQGASMPVTYSRCRDRARPRMNEETPRVASSFCLTNFTVGGEING